MKRVENDNMHDLFYRDTLKKKQFNVNSTKRNTDKDSADAEIACNKWWNALWQVTCEPFQWIFSDFGS